MNLKSQIVQMLDKINPATVDVIVRTTGAPRGDITKMLRQLQNEGLGRFVPGRRGNPSRFLAGPHVFVETPSLPMFMEHRISIRPGLSVGLPVDLSSGELATFLNFVQALYRAKASEERPRKRRSDPPSPQVQAH